MFLLIAPTELVSPIAFLLIAIAALKWVFWGFAVLLGPFNWGYFVFFSWLLHTNKGVEFILLSNRHQPKQANFYRQKLLPLSRKGKDLKFLRFSRPICRLQHWEAFATTCVKCVGNGNLAFIAACLDWSIQKIPVQTLKIVWSLHFSACFLLLLTIWQPLSQ